MKVAELGGTKLDYWVAKAEKLPIETASTANSATTAETASTATTAATAANATNATMLGQDGKFHVYIYRPDEDGNDDWYIYSPSTKWSQGGPIIEREGISVERTDRNPVRWMAIKPHETSNFREDYYYGHGSTYLEAAMRCYVRSKFGREVDDC